MRHHAVSYTHLDVYKRQGKARKYLSDFMLPFAWNERVQGGYEKYCERERIIELFTLSRSYQELKERLELKEIDDIKYLPCEIEMDDYFDDTVVNDENLPDVVMNVVEEYDDRMYLMLNKNTDGRQN